MLGEHLTLERKPVFLVDGSSFLYRAFYAYPDLKTSKGFPTNAIHILLRIMLKIAREEEPEYMLFLMDGKGPNFRHELFAEYKANRQKMPEALSSQIEPILRAVRCMGISNRVPEGIEADDCIASLSHRFRTIYPVVIVGSDKDLYQCLDSDVYLWDPGKKNQVYAGEDVLKTQGLRPEQWPDYQALVGDSSDNIPGVPGIGPKTAAKILATCPSLEDIRDHFSRLGKAEKRKLEPYLQQIFVYRQLTSLKKDACTDIRLKDLKVQERDEQGLLEFFKEYELRSLLNEISADGKQDLNSAEKDEAQKISVKKVSSLPELAKKNVGFVEAEKGFLLAAGDQEWLWDGSEQELAGALKHSLVFIPGYKDLIRRGNYWRALSIQCFFDVSLAAYLLNPEERDYSWAAIKRKMLPKVGVHARNEALACLKIGESMSSMLQAANLLPLMREMEMPLIPVLEAMERRGVRIDLQSFNAFLKEVRLELDELEKEIHRLAGETFNVRSSQQLADVLFGRLGLEVRRKTPKGAPSTSSQVLETMRGEHEIISLILRYRTLEKLRSTYLNPLPQKVDAQGRLHTHFNNTATATGRLSSSDPNVQNIPIKGEFGARMRACFVPREGAMLVGGDYSQIELRVLAHMSRDPELVDAFARNEDIHSRTAALLFEKSQDEVTRNERRKAKTVNFGLIYGMGPRKLSRELGISMNEAKEFIEKYFSKLKRVGAFFEEVEQKAHADGFVLTLAGRRRLLPDINSRNANLAQQARRMAVNTVIQGSAADIIKQAMLDVHNDPELRGMEAELILQVHDELLLEVPEADSRQAGDVLARLMMNAWKLSVPLAVDWGAGEDWSRAHSG
ncbi:MAG: DNA polymerase I [Thermodesulfobacteriota bacterium]